MVDSGERVYGVTTGFGRLAEILVPEDDRENLQRNLIRSHSSGVGDPMSATQVRIIMLLRVNSLARGHSGCREKIADLLIEFLNIGVHPIVPRYGSVGASGDLDGSHKLMKNNGDGTFTDVTTGSGVEDAPYGWYNFDGDFNNDGLIDILSNGRILLNQGGFKFAIYDGNIPGSGAIGDANNDGFLDIFDGNNLYQNSKNDNNWLKIITIGTSSNINGIGARIEIASDLGTQVRDVRSGTGFTYMGSLNTYFGLKQDSNINNLTIYWPSGIVDVLNNVNVNESLTVIEGQTLSVQSSEINQISVFPNPGVDFIEIKSNKL